MGVKEKLIELLDIIIQPGQKTLGDIADHLIARGVTVQGWISVNNRLPGKNTTVIAATDKGIVFQCLYAYDGWDLWDGNEINITHWQPMPEPPKGE